MAQVEMKREATNRDKIAAAIEGGRNVTHGRPHLHQSGKQHNEKR